MAVIGVGSSDWSRSSATSTSPRSASRVTSEVGGLQGTAQNLGTALGTAIIGSILLTTLLASFDNKIEANPAIPAKTQSQIEAKTTKGIQLVPADDVSEALKQSGVPESVAKPIVSDYSDAQITALKTALGGVAVVVVLGFSVTGRLPTEPLAPAGPPGAVATA